MSIPKLDPRPLLLEVHDVVATRAFERARDVTPSRFLANTMRLVYYAGNATLRTIKGAIEYEAYWALPLHDGRGEIVKPPGKGKGKWLVFFPDPNNDPRISPVPSNYPVRVRQVRKLTKAQFDAGIRQNVLRGLPPSGLASDIKQSAEPVMIVTKRVRGFDGYRWLTTSGIGGMVGVANEIAQSGDPHRAFGRALKAQLPKGVRRARLRIRG